MSEYEVVILPSETSDIRNLPNERLTNMQKGLEELEQALHVQVSNGCNPMGNVVLSYTWSIFDTTTLCAPLQVSDLIYTICAIHLILIEVHDISKFKSKCHM